MNIAIVCLNYSYILFIQLHRYTVLTKVMSMEVVMLNMIVCIMGWQYTCLWIRCSALKYAKVSVIVRNMM